LLLIIEIALGIVLAWYLINNMDAIASMVKAFVLAPFRLIKFVAVELFGMFAYLMDKLVWVFAIVVVIGAGALAVYGVFYLVPSEMHGKLIIAIFLGALAISIAIIAKDFFQILREKIGKKKDAEN
jgi:hypothetical protein